MALRLGRREFGEHEPVIMAVVDLDPGPEADGAKAAALDRVGRAVADGAAAVEVCLPWEEPGDRAGDGSGEGPVAVPEEEVRRTAAFVAEVRRRHPDVVIAVRTWRHEVAEAVCAAGADLLDDPRGGADPELAGVAARHRAGLVCTYTGRSVPDAVPDASAAGAEGTAADVLRVTAGLAERAVALGVPPESVLVSPGTDLSGDGPEALEAARHLGGLVVGGRPVLVSLSTGPSGSGAPGGSPGTGPEGRRMLAALATAAVAAWQGARVYRVHAVAETRQVLDMVASVAGHRPPAVARRGLG
ncbi:dihydropteroate synthase [Streptomyces sp. SCUT-3]|uniref:dihydropteroate synthase n=1 Tax=unclassified Streptomyces TaxID=2593676 RepID=UPI0015FBEE8B|nr:MULTISPECIES: dihydropteroate synthase [unclassified Streptomyces]MCZ2527693.1 dihydropteroate synthase [Streptomyces sp. HB2AG]QMV21888.1 dihydropteroate synthase [Streptomyces sp. SCUT-3]